MTTYRVSVEAPGMNKHIYVGAGCDDAACMIGGAMLLLMYPDLAKTATKITVQARPATYDEVMMAKAMGNQTIVTPETVTLLSAGIREQFDAMIFPPKAA